MCTRACATAASRNIASWVFIICRSNSLADRSKAAFVPSCSSSCAMNSRWASIRRCCSTSSSRIIRSLRSRHSRPSQLNAFFRNFVRQVSSRLNPKRRKKFCPKWYTSLMTFSKLRQERHREAFIEDRCQKAWGAACNANYVGVQHDKLMADYEKCKRKMPTLKRRSRRSTALSTITPRTTARSARSYKNVATQFINPSSGNTYRKQRRALASDFSMFCTVQLLTGKRGNQKYSPMARYAQWRVPWRRFCPSFEAKRRLTIPPLGLWAWHSTLPVPSSKTQPEQSRPRDIG